MFVKLAATCLGIGILLATAPPAHAQFTSGSTGVDGALDYTGQSGTIVFNPATFKHTATQPVYNFTTITIPSGVTVRLSGTMNPAPVIWLASGVVQIAGNVDISGSTGGCLSPTECRTPSAPGAGGSPGGVGGGSTTTPPEPGLGTLGGAAGTSASVSGQGGTFSGNSLLIPLVGGSGGGGNWGGGGGGAGGGALLIASSVSINLTGAVYAQGGSGGGGGSGGAIRLAAPTISGNGTFYLYGGLYGGCGSTSQNGGGGIARVESYNGWSFAIYPEASYNCSTASNGTEYLAAPYGTYVSSLGPTTITITTVNGVPVIQPPTGSFQTPDVTINTTGSVQLAIQATNVPVGSVVNLQFYSDNGPDIFVTSTPLAGTQASSTATATATFPTGYTRGLVYASFTGPAGQIAKPPAQ